MSNAKSPAVGQQSLEAFASGEHHHTSSFDVSDGFNFGAPMDGGGESSFGGMSFGEDSFGASYDPFSMASGINNHSPYAFKDDIPMSLGVPSPNSVAPMGAPTSSFVNPQNLFPSNTNQPQRTQPPHPAHQSLDPSAPPPHTPTAAPFDDDDAEAAVNYKPMSQVKMQEDFENYFNDMLKAAQTLQSYVSTTVSEVTQNVLTPLQERLRAERALASSLRERQAQLQQHLAMLKQLVHNTGARKNNEAALRHTIARTQATLAASQEKAHCRVPGVELNLSNSAHQASERQDKVHPPQQHQQQPPPGPVKRPAQPPTAPQAPAHADAAHAKRQRLHELPQQQKPQPRAPPTPEQTPRGPAQQHARKSPARASATSALAPSAQAATTTPSRGARKPPTVSLPRNLTSK